MCARTLTLTSNKLNAKLEWQQLKLLKWILKQKVNLEYNIMFIYICHSLRDNISDRLLVIYERCVRSLSYVLELKFSTPVSRHKED